MTNLRGMKHFNRKLTEDQVREIIAKRIDGMRVRELAAQFGCSPGHISKICNRQAWQHLKV